MAAEDNLRKALTFVFTVIGLGIFYVVIMTKLQVMADETKAKVLKASAENDYEDFLYKKTLDSVIDRAGSQSTEESSGVAQSE